jgi:hypothetical protein
MRGVLPGLPGNAGSCRVVYEQKAKEGNKAEMEKNDIMENNGLVLPEVGKISGLISALSDYAVKSAREQWAKNMSSVYLPPRVRCWDECAWFEVAKDRQIVNYLLSDLSGGWVLTRSLYFCIKWYGQAEIDRLQRMGN